MEFYEQNFEEINKIKDKFKNETNHLTQEDRLKFGYKIIDHRNDTLINRHTQCSKGCSFCCHDLILITATEYNLIKKSGKKPDSNLINIQKSSNFRSLPFAQKKCAFLIDNQCSIYEDRPLVCRKHNINKGATPEIDCIVGENGKTQTPNSQVFDLIAEGITFSTIEESVINNQTIKPIYNYAWD